MRNSSYPGKPEGEEGVKTLRRMNDNHAPLRAFGFSCVDFSGKKKILDVGCGGGMTIREMLDKAPESVIDGIDYSETAVEETKTLNGGDLGRRVFVQEADVSSLPFEDDTFDLVTGVETVYFWPDLQAGLREIFRVLKKGGTIAIFDESDDPEVLKVWPKIDGFCRIYTAAELESALESAGFSDVTVSRGPDGEMVAAVGRK